MRPITPIPLPEFRLRVLRYYTAGQKARKTARQLDHVLRLVEATGAATTADLTTETVAAVVLARGPAANPNTTRGLLARLKRCVHLAVKGHLLDRDEAPDWEAVRPAAAPPVRNRPHSAAEVARLLETLARGRDDWSGGRLHALGTLVAYTGLRRDEALHLRAEEVDLARGFVFVQARAGHRLKTAGSAAPVPIPEAAVGVLADWLPRCGGEWVFPGARSARPWIGGAPGYRPIDRLRQAGARVGLPAVGFHSLRHSLATQLLVTGIPEWAIQRMLRHTSPFATKHYLHPADRDVAALVKGFAYAMPAA